MTIFSIILESIGKREIGPWYQKIAILIQMQFFNDIIKSRHGFKTAQKFHKFRVLIKSQNL